MEEVQALTKEEVLAGLTQEDVQSLLESSQVLKNTLEAAKNDMRRQTIDNCELHIQEAFQTSVNNDFFSNITTQAIEEHKKKAKVQLNAELDEKLRPSNFATACSWNEAEAGEFIKNNENARAVVMQANLQQKAQFVKEERIRITTQLQAEFDEKLKTARAKMTKELEARFQREYDNKLEEAKESAKEQAIKRVTDTYEQRIREKNGLLRQKDSQLQDFDNAFTAVKHAVGLGSIRGIKEVLDDIPRMSHGLEPARSLKDREVEPNFAFLKRSREVDDIGRDARGDSQKRVRRNGETKL
ncbi:uncharacterized protein LY89DRAFT_688562 [Mollisia scopiformis]|uniref:Uncharacterized protein n=1 Tax=Mollisia scopiformis TaxID=149040 RepID=A0A194WVU8_MOLSC|nr:uncharacterized protein LY89DRAFT_688562 [Mollisia scopiformis]KUJ12090.1 hypothetical protein LY89DRAFT_688562 [Mollisia scopiformis]